MATASVGRRCRGRARAHREYQTPVVVHVIGAQYFPENAVTKSSTDDDSSDDSKESASSNTIDSEERKKKLDQLFYKFMARHLISGLQEHRLEQIMQKYMNLNDDQDAPPAAPPPSSSGSSIDGAKQVASDQPSPTYETSKRPVAVCETMTDSQPSSQVVIEDNAVNPKVAQDIVPDNPRKHVYIGRGRGRGIRYDTDKRIQGRGVRFD